VGTVLVRLKTGSGRTVLRSPVLVLATNLGFSSTDCRLRSESALPAATIVNSTRSQRLPLLAILPGADFLALGSHFSFDMGADRVLLLLALLRWPSDRLDARVEDWLLTTCAPIVRRLPALDMFPSDWGLFMLPIKGSVPRRRLALVALWLSSPIIKSSPACPSCNKGGSVDLSSSLLLRRLPAEPDRLLRLVLGVGEAGASSASSILIFLADPDLDRL